MKSMTFVTAMKDYFGLQPGETVSGFLTEIRALTDADKAWFRANLPSVGYEVLNVAA